MASLQSVLDGLTQAIAADEAAAAVSFDAEATLVGVTEVDVATGRHTFKVDEPEVLGGTDLAANPVQLVLASLGACQAITYRVWAAKLGIEIEGVEASYAAPRAKCTSRVHNARSGRRWELPASYRRISSTSFRPRA